MADEQHGALTPTSHPTGTRGNHTVEGFPPVADEAALAALGATQVGSDRGREVFQAGGVQPGWYRADGVGGWLFIGNVGSPLPNHGGVHVEGAADAIPNATGGVGGLMSAADKTRFDAKVFGENYQHVAALPRTTTGATAAPGSTKAVLTTPGGLPDGTYRVAYCCGADNEDAGDTVFTRLQNITDAVTLNARNNEPDDDTDVFSHSGFAEVVFAGGTAKSFEIQFWTTPGGTAGCQDAHIEFHRVG